MARASAFYRIVLARASAFYRIVLARAQDIIYDSPPGDYSGQSFLEMLKKLRDRLGHVMTDEERARIPPPESAEDPVD